MINLDTFKNIKNLNQKNQVINIVNDLKKDETKMVDELEHKLPKDKFEYLPCFESLEKKNEIQKAIRSIATMLRINWNEIHLNQIK